MLQLFFGVILELQGEGATATAGHCGLYRLGQVPFGNRVRSPTEHPQIIIIKLELGNIAKGSVEDRDKQSLELHDLAVNAVAEEVLQHPFPLLPGEQVLPCRCPLRLAVLLAQVVDVQGVELSEEFLVDVGVLAVCVAEEDGFAEMCLQGVDLLDFVALGAAGPVAKQTHLVVLHHFLAGNALLRPSLQLLQVMRWTQEDTHYLVAVFLGRFGSYLHLQVVMAEHVDDLLHHHDHVSGQFACISPVALIFQRGGKLLEDVVVNFHEEWIPFDLFLPGNGSANELVGGVLQQVIEQPGDWQLTALEVLEIEDGVEGDLVDECLEQQRENILHFLQAELHQFLAVLVKEGVESSQIFEENQNSLVEFLLVLVFAGGHAGEEDVGDGLAEDAGVPHFELVLMRLLEETLLVDEVSAAAELQEGLFRLQYLREDVLVAEVTQQVGVSRLAVLTDYALRHSLLILHLKGFQQVFLLGLQLLHLLLLLVIPRIFPLLLRSFLPRDLQYLLGDVVKHWGAVCDPSVNTLNQGKEFLAALLSTEGENALQQ